MNPWQLLVRTTSVGLSDESLLAGLASADPDTAAAFVRRFQGRVFGLAYAIVGDREVATEVAQEAFVRAWRHGAVYDARRGTVATWLLTITRNLAVDAARLRRAVPVDPMVLSALELPSSDPAPGEDVVSAAELDRLRRALDRLPAAQRRCLLLSVFHGLSGREISELDGVPLGTVKTRIRTALLTLRSSLDVSDD